MIHSPNTVIAEDLPAASQEETAKPEPQPTTDAKALLEAINAQRDDRDAKAKAESERESYRARAEAAEAKLTEHDKAKNIRLLDPAGYLKRLGYTDKELALTAEAIAFHLVPEKMAPDHRAKLVEAQMLRDREEREAQDKAREVAAKEAPAKESAAREQEITKAFTAAMKTAAKDFKPGAYPASQAWFADDHDLYSRELFSTARAMAEAASRAGTGRPDLSAEGVAKELEKSYAERAKRWASFSGPATTETAVSQRAVPQADSKIADAGDSSRETAPKEAPRGKKLTEREVIDRAVAAAFGRH